MRIQITFRPKIILTLLLAVVALNVASLVLFTRLDHVVHSDLYAYGLQFDSAWAEQYWTYSRVFTSAQIITILVAGISAALIITDIRTNRPGLRPVQYSVLIPGLLTPILSVFFFTRLGHVVHSDLYAYGLQFNLEWAVQYWTYANLILALTVPVIIGTVVAITLIFLSVERRARISKTQAACTVLVAAGAVILLLSTIYSSSIPAFIGLGLVFWGVILLYVHTEEYAKKILLDATASPSLTTLNKMIKALQYHGKPIYLPPKYLNNPEVFKVYIPRKKKSKLPTPEQTQDQEAQFSVSNPDGIVVTPPGAELAKLFEERLHTSFTRVDLQWLQRNLPKLLVEDLEVAQSIELEAKSSTILVKIGNVAYRGLGKEPADNHALEHPITSAIACALAKTTGHPITTGRQDPSRDGKSTIIEYHLANEE